MKIYATAIDPVKHREIRGIAVSEEGEQVAGHLSSSLEWLKHDLGLPSAYGAPFRTDIYDKKFGVGKWTIEWVEALPLDVVEKMKALQEKENVSDSS